MVQPLVLQTWKPWGNLALCGLPLAAGLCAIESFWTWLAREPHKMNPLPLPGHLGRERPKQFSLNAKEKQIQIKTTNFGHTRAGS